MSAEQQDGKVEITINFTNEPRAVWGNRLAMSPAPEWQQTLAASLLTQRHGRINREGKFTEACPVADASTVEVKEGDNSVRRLLDSWMQALIKDTPDERPEMELSPEIVAQVLDASGIDLSKYVVANIQCTDDPHVFNITLR